MEWGDVLEMVYMVRTHEFQTKKQMFDTYRNHTHYSMTPSR